MSVSLDTGTLITELTDDTWKRILELLEPNCSVSKEDAYLSIKHPQS